MVTDDPPIVAVNANSGNPHYEPSASRPVAIREGDFVLLDVWAKKNTPGAVYYDITWVGFVGQAPSGAAARDFQDCERGARYRREDGAGRGFCRTGRLRDGKWITRCAATSSRRNTESTSSTAPATRLRPRCMRMARIWMIWKFTTSGAFCPIPCFSIEPGIYLPEFGVRSEVDVLVRPGSAEVTGKIQREIVTI